MQRPLFRLLIAVVSLLWWVVTPSEAAFCGADFWGGRASSIDVSGPLTVTISAQTNVVHWTSHPLCSGDFSAKATLISGFGPHCESSTGSTNHTAVGTGTLALVQRQCAGLSYGKTYHAGGIHAGFGESEHYTESPGSVYFQEQTCDCDFDHVCCESVCFGTWDSNLNECNLASPILIALNHNGANYRLTSANDGVWFDIKVQGYARSVAWTARDSDVAFVVLDRNGNGSIDDGSELFGNVTPLAAGECAPNGFVALSELDSNGDGRVDEADFAYHALRLWVDRNHDGISQPDELATLASKGVVALLTSYRESRRRDRHGNWYRYEGVAIVRERAGELVPRRVVDVFLVLAPE